uniref:Serpentine receptor class gamma n=1 Tax=Panagrellus redivivus TaxID=6233 RepID=A0A7E4VEG1_PANRE
MQAMSSFISTIGLYFMMRLSLAPIMFPILLSLPSSGVIPTIVMFVGILSLCMMNMTEAVMSFNRASVVLFGVKHKEIWIRLMKWVRLIVTVPSLGITWNIWLQNATIDPIDKAHPELGYNWIYGNPERSWMNTTFCLFVMTVFTAVWNFFWNMFTLVTIVKRYYFKSVKNYKISANVVHKFIFTFYLFMLQITHAVFVILEFYLGISLFPFTYFVMDAVHFTVPWMFLYTQIDVKAACKNVIRRMFNVQNEVSVMHHFSQITVM